MPNFQRIVDIFASALSILDFSHIISGVATSLLLLLYLYVHGVQFPMPNNAGMYVCAVVFVYIAGLSSWLLGSLLRSICFRVMELFKKQFHDLVQSAQISMPDHCSSMNESSFYTYMWIQLEKVAPERTSFINRFWVMQAMFEGLFATALLGLICSFELAFGFFQVAVIVPKSVIYGGMFLLSVFGTSFLYGAKKQAETQIKEVVLAYKIYCEPGNLE